MKIEPCFKERYLPIALHEAGHFVAATFLGFKTGDIHFTIIADNKHKAYSDICSDKPFNILKEDLDYCVRRVQVLYAGALAETLINGKIDKKRIKEIFVQTARNDYSKIQELISNIRNIDFPLSTNDEEIKYNFNKIDKKLKDKAVKIVQENKDVILEIGFKLLDGLTDYKKEFILDNNCLNSMPKIIEIKHKTHCK